MRFELNCHRRLLFITKVKRKKLVELFVVVVVVGNDRRSKASNRRKLFVNCLLDRTATLS